MCTIKVDGSQGNAHVIFDDSTTLGVIAWEDYRVGNALNVKQGEQRDIIAFNGDSSGAITFTLSFSNAKALAAGILAFATLVMN